MRAHHPAARPHARGARDLVEARTMAAAILEPQPVTLPEEARPTLARFAELRSSGLDGKDIVRELKAVGGDLRHCGSPSPESSAGRSSGR